jgi:hypothetical protein
MCKPRIAERVIGADLFLRSATRPLSFNLLGDVDQSLVRYLEGKEKVYSVSSFW